MNALKNRILQAEACLGMVKEEAERLFPEGKLIKFKIAHNQKNHSTGTVMRVQAVSYDTCGGRPIAYAQVVIKHDQAKPRSRYAVRTITIDRELVELNNED